MLGVAFNAVAAVDLRERRRHVRGRAEDVGVGERSGELHPLQVPVSPKDSLNLKEKAVLSILLDFFDMVNKVFYFLK